MKRSREERLASEHSARRTQDVINRSSEIYKNRFKNGGRKVQLPGSILDLDEDLMEMAEEAFSD